MKHFMEDNYPFLLAGLILAAIIWAGWMESQTTQEERQQRREANYCHSKTRGSRPACWTKKDWERYCTFVECKSLPKE